MLIKRKHYPILEDKRVLFNPTDMEDAGHCSQSVICIRSTSTKELQKLSTNSILLKKIIKACQEFNNRLGHTNFTTFEKPIQNSILEREPFKLREKCGASVAQISFAYDVDVDVDDGLASIIPFNNVQNT